MKASIGFRIGVYLYPIHSHTDVFPIGLLVHLPHVGIDKILVFVVRRINVDALNPVAVGGEQTFQDFEILSLNDRVPLGKLWIYRALGVVPDVPGSHPA